MQLARRGAKCVTKTPPYQVENNRARLGQVLFIYIYRAGKRGVGQDYAAAVEIWLRSMGWLPHRAIMGRRGISAACVAWAVVCMCGMGCGVERDYAEALRW